MLFFLGFLLGILGFAMLMVGSFPWPGGRRISARPARLAGTIFLAFFPLALVARQGITWLELDWINPLPVYWVLASGCILAGLIILLRSAAQSAPGPRAAGQAASNPFAAAEAPAAKSMRPAIPPEEAAPRQIPASAKPKSASPKPRPESEKNPFDFS